MAPPLRQRVKRLLERVFRVRIYGTRVHGRDDCADIASCGLPMATIVDVGANVGQSARRYRAAFPEATIHCIEPVGHVFEKLALNLKNDHRTRLHRIALGSREGAAPIYLGRHPTTSSLIPSEQALGSELVTVRTLTGFAGSLGIDRIDLLKVDAEGFDLEVLRGAERLLAGGDVKFLLVEVGFTPGDRRHVLFDDVRSFLARFGFRLFGLYDQQPEWSGPRFLRYCNACFCHSSVFPE